MAANQANNSEPVQLIKLEDSEQIYQSRTQSIKFIAEMSGCFKSMQGISVYNKTPKGILTLLHGGNHIEFN